MKRVIEMSKGRSRVVLTSGGIEPVLDGLRGPHSIFAAAFLDVLLGNAGVLPAQDLHRYLQSRVIAGIERGTSVSAQSPEYAPIKYAGHERGDFVFVRVR
jgi:hypothetical protein